MRNKKEINAGIIIIGNEVLSGRTKDINTSTLSLWLNSLGVQVKEVRIIPDIEKDIIETINTFKNKFSYVFTTGGIGPTHDDITAESVSKAFNIEYGYHKEALSILEKYYKPNEFSEGRKKMAMMPMTAKLILNPTSGAPGFIVENVFTLPGVPSILQSMLGSLKNQIVGGRGYINAGVYVLSKNLIMGINSKKSVSLEKEIFPAYLQKNLQAFLLSDNRFIDIGTPSSLAQAQSFFRNLSLKKNSY